MDGLQDLPSRSPRFAALTKGMVVAVGLPVYHALHDAARCSRRQDRRFILAGDGIHYGAARFTAWPAGDVSPRAHRGQWLDPAVSD